MYNKPTHEQLEKDLKTLEIDISKYNELNKKDGQKGQFDAIIKYCEAQRNLLLYALGYIKEMK